MGVQRAVSEVLAVEIYLGFSGVHLVSQLIAFRRYSGECIQSGCRLRIRNRFCHRYRHTDDKQHLQRSHNSPLVLIPFRLYLEPSSACRY